MKRIPWVSMILIACGSAYAAGPVHEAHTGMDALEAMERLKGGNKRYVENDALHSNQAKDRREEVAGGQHPFAIILGCADSRVPPELIFDQGLGDLFVNRVAGNIVNDAMLGSIEYAVEHLGVKLLVVLGHENAAPSRPVCRGETSRATSEAWSMPSGL